MPYSSPFEAAVGNFLQNYAAMKGLKVQQSDQRIRERQATTQDQLAQIQMNEAGYDRIQMPKIEAPPDQSFMQRVGRFLSGGPDEPGSIVMKTHESAHERDAAAQQAFTLQRDQSNYANQRSIEELRAAMAARATAAREAAANARNDADNRTQRDIAGMNRGIQQQRINNDERDAFFDRAVEAAGGDAVQAMKNAERFQKGQAVKFGATRTDYHAAAARFKDRRAALTRETLQTRENIAGQKGAAQDEFRRKLKGEASADPVATMSDADAWEYYVKQGVPPAEATARVNARKK